MNRLFGFLKSFTQFLKIILLVLVMLILLHWIQNLIHGGWGWMKSVEPFLKPFLDTGAFLAPGSTEIYDVKFEFRYPIALVIILILFLLSQVLYNLISTLEKVHNESQKIIRRIEENNFNKKLENEQTIMQMQIKNYVIYVSAEVKPKFSHQGVNIDMDEQFRLMNEFLIKKTGTMPEKYKGGFLYKFYSFNEIDSVLENFFKLIHSTAPIDYLICVQILNPRSEEDYEKLDKLIGLKLFNKIVLHSDTSYRYKFNKSHRYEVDQIGLYQKDGSTYEVSEFREMN